MVRQAHHERKYENPFALSLSKGDLAKQGTFGAKLDPEVVSGLRPRQDSFISRLTPRQQEVLSLMAQGYNNTAIAENLVLGYKSVENYINAIYQELNLAPTDRVHPRVYAVLSYIQESYSQ